MSRFSDSAASWGMSKRSRRTALRTIRQSRSDRPSNEVPVLRASSIPDLLGSVPALFGFHPQRSLAVLTMKGKRIGFRARTDLPAPEYADACAHNLMGSILAQSAKPDGVLLVAYVDPASDADACGEDRAAADSLVEAMRTRLTDERIEVREAVCCDGSRYWSYLCDDERCCPSEGTPYSIESTSTMANAVFNGLEVLPDREALARRFDPPDGERREHMEEVTQSVVEEIAKEYGIFLGGSKVSDRFYRRRTELLRAGAVYVEGVLGDIGPSEGTPGPLRGIGIAQALDDETAARLMVWTRLLPVRDLAWSFITDANAPEHLALWTAVAGRAIRPFEPAPLCLAGFSAWLAGDGAQALCALRRASEVAPRSYSLVGLLMNLLERAVPPSAWREFDEATIRAPFGLRANDGP